MLKKLLEKTKSLFHRCKDSELVKKLSTFDNILKKQNFIEIRRCKKCKKVFALQITPEGNKPISLEYVRNLIGFSNGFGEKTVTK